MFKVRYSIHIIFILSLTSFCYPQSFSTYFGWGDSENNVDVEIINNEIYVAGNSNSNTTLSPTSSYYGYVAKYSLSGNLIWVKILDGNQDDFITRIKAKSNGNLIICGHSSSSSFLGNSISGYKDAFIIEMDASSNVIWVKTYGGSGADAAYAMDIKNDTIWVGGITTSTNFSTTPGAYQTYFSGSLDIFLMKIDALGNILYSTYFGSTSFEDIHDLKIDHNGDVILTGETGGLNFPTLNCYQCSIHTMIDGYLSKFSKNGSLLFSTYFGGNHIDDAYCIEIDASNQIYLLGNTQSSDLPTTGGTYQTNYGGNIDIWYSKFSSTGTLLWSNYLGGNLDEKVYSSTMKGNYLLFTSESLGNVSYYLFQEQTLLCSDTIGGSGMEIPFTIKEYNGYIILAGATSSSDFPVFNAQQPNLAGSDDGFVIKDNNCQVLILYLTKPINTKSKKVYPNPYRDILHADFEYDEIEIYDNTGKLIYKGKNTSHPEFRSGVYLFKFLRNNSLIFTTKIIKSY